MRLRAFGIRLGANGIVTRKALPAYLIGNHFLRRLLDFGGLCSNRAWAYPKPSQANGDKRRKAEHKSKAQGICLHVSPTAG